MTNNETSPLNDHLLALGATPADARALRECLLDVREPGGHHAPDHVDRQEVEDAEDGLADVEVGRLRSGERGHGAPIIEALRAVVAPATVDAERHDLVIEAMMGLHPEDGSGPPTDPALNAVGSAIFVLGQAGQRPRLASSAVSNLLGAVMDRDREAGERCLRALWAVAAAGVAEKPTDVH